MNEVSVGFYVSAMLFFCLPFIALGFVLETQGEPSLDSEEARKLFVEAITFLENRSSEILNPDSARTPVRLELSNLVAGNPQEQLAVTTALTEFTHKLVENISGFMADQAAREEFQPMELSSFLEMVLEDDIDDGMEPEPFTPSNWQNVHTQTRAGLGKVYLALSVLVNLMVRVSSKVCMDVHLPGSTFSLGGSAMFFPCVFAKNLSDSVIMMANTVRDGQRNLSKIQPDFW